LDAPDAPWRELGAAELPAPWRERLARLRSGKARRETLAGLWLLREGAAHGGWLTDLSRLRREPDGRPILPGGPAFSISHTDDLAVCAIAPGGRLGVDVERIRAIDTDRLARFLGPEKHAAAREDPAVFFRAWTAREAAVKATGRVGLARVAGVRVRGDTAEIDGDTLYLMRPTLDAGHAVCVACDEPGAAIRPAVLP